MRTIWLLGALLALVGCGDSPETDAGTGMDAGARMDAGAPGDDAGPRQDDAGPGPGDAGESDAGGADSGMADAGTPDAGMSDAGAPDAGMSDAGAPDAGSVTCAPPADFGMGGCFGDSDCLAMECWMEAGPIPPAGCLFSGCSAPCATDADCQCMASMAGATTPSAATCSAGACDLTGTGLGSPFVCT